MLSGVLKRYTTGGYTSLPRRESPGLLKDCAASYKGLASAALQSLLWYRCFTRSGSLEKRRTRSTCSKWAWLNWRH